MKGTGSDNDKTRENVEKHARNSRQQVLDSKIWDNALRLVDDGGDTVRMNGLHFLKKENWGRAQTAATARTVGRVGGIGWANRDVRLEERTAAARFYGDLARLRLFGATATVPLPHRNAPHLDPVASPFFFLFSPRTF